MQNVSPAAAAALVGELSVAGLFGFAPEWTARVVQRWPTILKILCPALFVLPYAVIAASERTFRWPWFGFYLILPVAIAWLLYQAAQTDREQRGNWRDAVILLFLGLAVDLRWLDKAWPDGLQALGKILLVDVGLYGFLAIRQLRDTGFDFRLKSTDFWIGLRELAFFTPIVLALGLALGFIHPHANLPAVGTAFLRWIGIFFFIAVPEELFFRAWVQNLLERRMGRTASLVTASILFGLSHFNKRSADFNWRYVVLASIAGIFYGRAWRDRRRVPASSITHTFVDWIWFLWF